MLVGLKILGLPIRRLSNVKVKLTFCANSLLKFVNFGKVLWFATDADAFNSSDSSVPLVAIKESFCKSCQCAKERNWAYGSLSILIKLSNEISKFQILFLLPEKSQRMNV